MSALVTRVDIENFRSIRRVSIPLNYLSVLVGTNDSGKSNVLRALNLFFNGETNPGQRFNFDVDHNVYNEPNRRAKEIVVRLHIELPDAYVATNGHEVVWEKRWRDFGPPEEKKCGVRITSNRRGSAVRTELELPARSNVHSLLRKMEFVYVPAVRDSTYFDFLRGQIHSVISEVADATFRISSTEFETAIAHHLRDLTSDIGTELGIASKLALPKDLTHVFEKLDFLTGDRGISLDARGDGIKARHIPLILKFMADQKRRLQTRGAAPISIFWGYEEPENNLEFSNAVALADELWKFMEDDVAQVLVTSHSPVFYNLQSRNTEEEDYVTCLHVFRDTQEVGTEVTSDLEDLDDRLGTTAVLAPRIAIIEDRIRAQERARQSAERLAAAGRCKIFVEGDTDRIFVQRLLQVFDNGLLVEVADIETLPTGAGHSYVADMLRAWYCTQKHRGGRPRSIGLVDNDAPGNELKRGWNAISDQAAICKCFVWEVPPHARRARQQGFSLPVTLEELYPASEWHAAHARGSLEPRAVHSILGGDRVSQLVRGEATLRDYMTDETEIYVMNQFTQGGKRPAVTRITELPEQDFADAFRFLQPLVQSISTYLRD